MNKCLLILFGFLAIFEMGCTSSSTGSSISPISAAVCDVESAITSAEAVAIASLLTCSNESTIQSSLQTALGNANLCSNASISAATAAQIASAKAAHAVKTAGMPVSKAVIGDLACPIVVNVLIGFGTSSIPTSWGCSASSTASSFMAALTTACESAVPF